MYDGLKPPTESKRGPFFERAALAFVFLAGCAIVSLLTAWLLESFQDFSFPGEAPASELAVLNSETPTTIPAAIATDTPTVRPTEIPAATATWPALFEEGQPATPEDVAYFNAMDPVITSLSSVVGGFQDRNREIVDDPRVLYDDDWKLKVEETLAEFKFLADTTTSIEDVPPRFQRFHELMVLLANEIYLLIDNYAMLVKNEDWSFAKHIKDNLNIIVAHMREIEQELLLINDSF